MISTTSEWKKALGCQFIEGRDNLVPVNDVEIEYEQVDAIAQTTADVTSSGAESFSDTDDILDVTVDYSSQHFIGTLEPNEWILDGNSVPTDADTDCGWIGNTLCGSNKEFANAQTVTLSLDEARDMVIPGLTIQWSTLLNEWATDFEIISYKNSSQKASARFYPTSSKDFYAIDLDDYDEIKIKIYSWSVPYRRARIESVIMGMNVTISKSEIISAEHNLSSDLLSFTLPDDNFTFEINNISQEWNPDNPTGRYAYLAERQRVNVRYAFKINNSYEWHQFGTYFMSDWTTPQNGITASFTARSLVDFMTKKFVPASIPNYTFGDDISLKDLADAAFSQANLPIDTDGSEKWEIADELDDVNVVIPWSSEESGYTKLDYIQSSGTQYINTQYNLTANSKIEFKFREYQYSRDNVPMGVTQSAPEYTIYHHSSEVSNRFYTYYNGQITDTGVTADTAWHTLVVDHKNKKQIFDGTERTLQGDTFTTTIPYYVFAGNNNGTASWYSDYQVSSLKIWDNDVLQREFVPAKRDRDDAIGFYDLVNDEFYANSGSGTFTYGAEQGAIIKNPKYDFDYTCAEVIQLCANAGCAVIRPNENGDICIEMPERAIADYYIDTFVSYKIGEYELSKSLKDVNINNGDFIYTPSDSVPTGEEQAINNVLIQNSSQKSLSGAWMSDLLLKRRSINGEFRADPRLQPLDVIKIENKYASNQVYIDEVKWSYAGAFKGSYHGKVLKTLPLVDQLADVFCGDIDANNVTNSYSGGYE